MPQKVHITSFIVKRPENLAYDLANTLKGLEIFFSFIEFLFCSPQVLSPCNIQFQEVLVTAMMRQQNQQMCGMDNKRSNMAQIYPKYNQTK
jgi:hypothetical protein